MYARIRTLIGLTLFVLFMIAAPAFAEGIIQFADPADAKGTWPKPITITVQSAVTQPLELSVRLSNLKSADDKTILEAAAYLELPDGPILLEGAGETAIILRPRGSAEGPPEGSYIGTLTISAARGDNETVLRKKVILTVAPETTPAPAATTPLTPTVASWTIQAYRVAPFLPFVPPVCLQGVPFRWSCALPTREGTVTITPGLLGTLPGDRGGGLRVKLNGVQAERGALLRLQFDSPWGLAGTYKGKLDLQPAVKDAGEVDVTVNVKDILLWPVMTILAGVWIARGVQRYITVGRDANRWSWRVTQATANLEKPDNISGYTVKDDAQNKRESLLTAIDKWRKQHYGEPDDEGKAQRDETIIKPLTELEAQAKSWSELRAALDSLKAALDEKAAPAIAIAKPHRPEGVTLEEPAFYPAARALLAGKAITLAEIDPLIAKTKGASDLAAQWGEWDQDLVRLNAALAKLEQDKEKLTPEQLKKLAEAKENRNEGARDLWEAASMSEMEQEGVAEALDAALDISQRLPDAYPVKLRRSFTDRLLLLTSTAAEARPTPAEQATALERTMAVQERRLYWVALIAAIIGGLGDAFGPTFGSLKDYLTLLAWGLGAKAALEVANAALSSLAGLKKS